MKKSLIALSASAVLFSGLAFAAATNTAVKPQPHKDDKFHQAISECMAAAGIEKPEMPSDANHKMGEPKAGERPEPPKDANGQPMPPKDGQAPTGDKPPHPHPQMTDAQRQQVDSCMSAKGYEKPKDMPKDMPKVAPATNKQVSK